MTVEAKQMPSRVAPCHQRKLLRPCIFPRPASHRHESQQRTSQHRHFAPNSDRIRHPKSQSHQSHFRGFSPSDTNTFNLSMKEGRRITQDRTRCNAENTTLSLESQQLSKQDISRQTVILGNSLKPNKCYKTSFLPS